MLYCSWQSYLRTYLLNSFISHDNAPNSISAGAPTQTPLGELTALPQTPVWIQGGLYFSANLFTVDSRRVVPAR